MIGFSSAQNSSTAKGESVSDTIRTVGSYSDIIAMRHPNDGAPILAKETSSVPIINAGDGGHLHPTQTLTDLTTIAIEKGRFSNLTIGLCGDLKFGRTVHSLIAAMSRYDNIKFVLISPDELKIPDYIKEEQLEKNNIEYIETESIEEHIDKLDILYMTRVQRERFENQDEYERLKDCYILTLDKLKNAKKDLVILHPLPRVNEIAKEVDSDSRACYFKQVEYGRYIRMALILKLLEEKDTVNKIENDKQYEELLINRIKCKNPRCISYVDERVDQVFKLVNKTNKIYRCKYCETQEKMK